MKMNGKNGTDENQSLDVNHWRWRMSFGHLLNAEPVPIRK
jgi:hypothetical protein